MIKVLRLMTQFLFFDPIVRMLLLIDSTPTKNVAFMLVTNPWDPDFI